MKRNFLLMLLLTLLPLVSWAAEPISSVKLSVENVPYGTPALTQANFRASWDNNLTYGTDILWNGKYYSDEACTTEVTDLATAPVGTYWVRFDGDRYYKGSVAKPFEVKKAPLYVSVVVDQLTQTDAAPGWAGGTLKTTYGVPFDKTGKSIKAYVGLQNGELFKDVVTGTLTAITCEQTNANAHPSTNADGFVPFYANQDPANPTVGGYVDPYTVTFEEALPLYQAKVDSIIADWGDVLIINIGTGQ